MENTYLDEYLDFLARARKTHNEKLYTLSYLLGLGCVQRLLKVYDGLDDDGKKQCSKTLSKVMGTLEKTKKKWITRYGGSKDNRNGGQMFVETVSDNENGRQFLNRWALNDIQRVEMIINNGVIDSKTVGLLLDIKVVLETSLDMYSKKQGDDMIDEMDKAGDKLGKSAHVDEDKDEGLSVEKLQLKIDWCNDQIDRIVQSFKEGKDPNSVGIIDTDLITQEDINKVIKDVMEESSESEETGSDESKSEENSISSSKSTDLSKKVKNRKSLKLNSGDIPDKATDPPQSMPAPTSTPKISPASLIASKEPEKIHQQPNKPITLETVEKELANEELLDSATKCCKFGMSAIAYKDVTTAIDELNEAIKLLHNYQDQLNQ